MKTDHILFIAGGAFSQTKVTDLLPELLGRIPVRVNLKALNIEDYKQILTATQYNLLAQVCALLK